ncbi:MAG: hypothetical protein MJB14_13495 [Spirochaetes bacterium]|nr:hypothetical protein [Spirochaetota bacterium]
MFQTVDSALDYIYSFINLENNLKNRYIKKEYSLDNIRKILKFLGNPEKNKKIIHIAGTKGKGSTSLFITRLLNQLNYQTVTFLSPHLIHPQERIQINLKPIDDKSLIAITNDIYKKIQNTDLIPTTFELFFLISLLAGEKYHVDYYVLETGLGGRLDCTNVVDPVISVVTSLGYDHTSILGSTLKQIAFEKGGIVKKNKKVVISPQQYRCTHYIRNICQQRSAPYFEVQKLTQIENIKYLPDGLVFDYYLNKQQIKQFRLEVLGKHQIKNFLTALLTIFSIHPEILESLSQINQLDLVIPGRLQILSKDPFIILDVAHNAESAKQCCETLQNHFPKTKWNILAGLALDKNYSRFFNELRPLANKLYITQLSQYKQSKPESVYQIAKAKIKNVQLVDQQNTAFQICLNTSEPLLITGSFYLAGPFLEYFKNKNHTKK